MTVWPPLKGEVAAKRTEGFNHTEFGNLNLWFPEFVDRTGGSRWNRALPGGLH